MLVTLQILAQDIKESNYGHSHDCAITRALRRALPDENLREGGGTIKMYGFHTSLVDTPVELSKKVMGMYRYVQEERNGDKDPRDEEESPLSLGKALAIPPEDFTYEIDIPLEP